MAHKFVSVIAVLALAFLFFPVSQLMADDASPDEVIVRFSPADECGKMILDEINRAEKSIELAMYYFTSRTLSRALISAVKRGVKVRAFLDGESAREYYSKATFLKKNGALVKLENGKGLMHNKFCIIDDTLVITGSYNWTTSADLRNDENVIFITSIDAVKTYRIQFEKYWQGNYPDEAYYINKNTLEKAGVR